MGQREHVGEVVAHQQDRLSFLVEPRDQMVDLRRLAYPECCGRFVHERSARRFEQRARHRDALALPARELRDRDPHRGQVDAESGDGRGGLADHPPAVDDDAKARRHPSEKEIVGDVALVDEGQVLEHRADAERPRPAWVVDALAVAVHPDRARVGLGDPRENGDEGGLAGSVVADEREDLAGVERDRDVVERGHMAEELGDAARLEEGLPRRGRRGVRLRIGRGFRSHRSTGRRPVDSLPWQSRAAPGYCLSGT